MGFSTCTHIAVAYLETHVGLAHWIKLIKLSDQGNALLEALGKYRSHASSTDFKLGQMSEFGEENQGFS